jgi:hypothetical protein
MKVEDHIMNQIASYSKGNGILSTKTPVGIGATKVIEGKEVDGRMASNTGIKKVRTQESHLVIGRVGRKAGVVAVLMLLIALLLIIENILVVCIGLDVGYEGPIQFAIVFIGPGLVNLSMAFIEVRLLAETSRSSRESAPKP